MPSVDLDKFKQFTKQVRKSESKYVTFGSASELNLLPSHVPYGIPTGIPQFDWSIGRNGYPAGRIIELWGFEMSGKSAAAMSAMASVHALGGFGCWIETEHTFDGDRLSRAGVDLERLIIAESDTIEGIFKTQNEILDQREKAGLTEPFLFVIDSIGAVTSEMDIERFEKDNWNTSQVGIDSKQTKGLLRILNSKLARNQCTTIFINHGTEIVSAMPGKKSKAGGGHAVKFYASLRAEFVKIGNIKDEEVDKNTSSLMEGRRAGQKIQVNLEKLKGTRLNRAGFQCSLIDGLFDPYESLMYAMIDSGLLLHSKGSPMVTLDPGEGPEQTKTFKRLEFREVIDEMGGYAKVYKAWLNWCHSKGKITLWGQ